MKKLFAIVCAISSSLHAFAQESLPEKSFWSDPFNDPMLPVYVVMALVLVVIILVASVAMYLLKVLNMLIAQADKERAAKFGITYVARTKWWKKFAQSMNASVPVSEEQDIELDHNFDGIKELDNHLPPWWKWLFYGTIGWSVVYMIVFHISSSLPLSNAEYEYEVAVAEEQARKIKASRPQIQIDENALTFNLDSVQLITNGKNVFIDNNCGSCHRQDGGGNSIGPNLTDEYWLHGGHIKNVFFTIRDGVVEKGMPAWGRSLSPTQVRDVAFFVMSLQGSQPANAKAPQGEIYKPLSIQPDSTKRQASL